MSGRDDRLEQNDIGTRVTPVRDLFDQHRDELIEKLIKTIPSAEHAFQGEPPRTLEPEQIDHTEKLENSGQNGQGRATEQENTENRGTDKDLESFPPEFWQPIT